jgi:anti-anti-sigma factor
MVTIELKENEKTMYCTFTGHLDTNTSIQDGETINREMIVLKGLEDSILKGDVRVTFDMREVTFISSSLIRICIAIAKQLPSGNFSVTNCDPFVNKTFKIAGLDSSLLVSGR